MSPTTCKGFTAGGVAAGIKSNGDLDLGLLLSDRPAVVSAVFIGIVAQYIDHLLVGIIH